MVQVESKHRHTAKTSQSSINPILRHILTEASGIKSSRAEEHINLVRERKRQELQDYVIVCLQRLDSTPFQTESLASGRHREVHNVIEETLRRWRE